MTFSVPCPSCHSYLLTVQWYSLLDICFILMNHLHNLYYLLFLVGVSHLDPLDRVLLKRLSGQWRGHVDLRSRPIFVPTSISNVFHEHISYSFWPSGLELSFFSNLEAASSRHHLTQSSTLVFPHCFPDYFILLYLETKPFPSKTHRWDKLPLLKGMKSA